MGGGHMRGLKRQQEKLNIDVLQTCDVYRKRAEKAAQVIGSPAKAEPGNQAKHRANFVQAMRDPKVELYCPVSLGLRTNVGITLGVRSYRERKVYAWNAKEQKAQSS
jgi:hypothetical protein